MHSCVRYKSDHLQHLHELIKVTLTWSILGTSQSRFLTLCCVPTRSVVLAHWYLRGGVAVVDHIIGQCMSSIVI